MYSVVKQKIYILLNPSEGESFWDKLIDGFIVSLILLNIVAVILETVDSIYIRYKPLFSGFELFSISVFTLEYILRIWSCTSVEKYSHPFTGRLKYILSLEALIDLFAIVPFYLPLSNIYDLRFVRIFRLVRFLRIFKLVRYLKTARVISNVFNAKKGELILCFAIILSMVVFVSCMMYFVEHSAQPTKFSSIPETMWWSVTTLTTVGYGDVVPVTAFGKVLTAFISILGIGMFALPAGILASGFSDEFKRHTKSDEVCAHCGREKKEKENNGI